MTVRKGWWRWGSTTDVFRVVHEDGQRMILQNGKMQKKKKRGMSNG